MPPSHSNPLLAAALRYIRLGWPVLPLRGKIPRVPNGSKDATLSEDQARSWWEQWPDANVGVATGIRFFVLDVDVKGGGEDSFEYFVQQHGRFPDTAQQVTGTGGKHLLFALPDFPVRNSAGVLAPGIDIRGSGGYIVVAPSVHPETKREYFWDGAVEIDQQPIAFAPKWLLERLKGGGQGKQPAGTAAPAKITAGGRNTAMFKLACSLRRKGLDEPEILATLKASNALRCVPPLPDAELGTIAGSAARYSPAEAGNVFRGDQQRSPGEGSEESPVTHDDVLAAVDEAIAADDPVGVISLVPSIAAMRAQFRAVVRAKLLQHFGPRKFPWADFSQALKEAGGDAGDVPPAAPEGGKPGSDGPDLTKQPMTDAGNGERLVALFGHELRYCIEMRNWLIWDGKRWAVDHAVSIKQKAKQMARLTYIQAIGNEPLSKHARNSESHKAITSAIACAATEKGIAISTAELDQQPYLLNCPNGVVDLRDGTLLPHDPAFLITKLCPVEYHPEKECPRFQAFVEWAMGGNPDADLSERTVRLVGFLQRAFGYALTSDVTEKALFIFYGNKGNNGKTTLLTLFRDLLGKDYSAQISIETVMAAKSQDATMRADLADLRGSRFVVTSEVEKEHKLNEGKIKFITAGLSEIKACRKYENPIEFRASHKLFMDCNHRPAVRGNDDAIWSRLKLVPFEVRVEKEQLDTSLPAKLRAELEGVLAWAVRGCMAWMKEGLGEPPEVAAAGQDWREHDDPLKDFLDDCCEIDPEYFIRATDLGAGYEIWCKQNRERFPLGREAFNERLLSKGFKQSRSRRIDGKQARTWDGIQLKPEMIEALRRQGTPRHTMAYETADAG